jgi:hypothetical protein
MVYQLPDRGSEPLYGNPTLSLARISRFAWIFHTFKKISRITRIFGR